MNLLSYPTSGPSNYERAAWASSGLDAYARLTRHDPAEQEVTDAESLTEILRDFLCDARHLCDEYGVNIETLFTDSREMRDVEVREDVEDPIEIAIEQVTVTRVIVAAEDLDAVAEDWREGLDVSGEPILDMPYALSGATREAIGTLTANLVASQGPDTVVSADVVEMTPAA